MVEKRSGCPPETEGNPENKTNDCSSNCAIYYSEIPTHPSILNIKSKTLLRIHLTFQQQLRAK